MADGKPDVAQLRRRRGAVRGSLTRLETRLKEAEDAGIHLDTPERAEQLYLKLKDLDSSYRDIHMGIIDLIEDDDTLDSEQAALDKHDDDVTDFTVRLQYLMKSILPAPTDTSGRERRSLSLKLCRLEKGLRATDTTISALSRDTADVSLVQQHQEQLLDYKRDLSIIYDGIVALDPKEDDDLLTQHSRLEATLFECSRITKEILNTGHPDSATVSVDSKGVRLPKLDVPTFDGNILHWRQFWQQFCVSVHDRNRISNAEKLVYLRHALKDGSAKSTIEGLSQSSEQYVEAVAVLKGRYDRPRLIHQAHVRLILEAPSLKEGTGKELRRLHDVVIQHLRALKSMAYDPSGPFITSTLELKLDTTTLFEWQKHSQSKAEVPHYQDLLAFLDLRAQASEGSTTVTAKKSKTEPPPARKTPASGGSIPSFASQHETVSSPCVLCTNERHPLYICPKFRALSHDAMFSVVKSNNVCTNCLTGGHSTRQCRSIHKCHKCQKPHHTLLHIEKRTEDNQTPATVPSHTAVKLKSSLLLMTCRILVSAPDGSTVQARALLDNASSASFVSERLVQSLCLPRVKQDVRVSGIGGLSHDSPVQFISSFQISAIIAADRKIDITAVIVPKVTCDLPVHPVPFDLKWKHLSDIALADPTFGQPGRIDILLGVDVFTEVLRQGRRTGPTASPVAFETEFGWVLGGRAEPDSHGEHVATHCGVVECREMSLRKFWEIEESPNNETALSLEERSVMDHFKTNHFRTKEGRFVVPLPKKPDAHQLGESRAQAVRRFLSLERSLTSKNQFQEFEKVMREYFDLGHAELVPAEDLEKPKCEVFYMPMHAVYKRSSTTTKIRAVFDASAKSSTGTSLNDILLVGPTVHPNLIDVLLRFRRHRIAITTDVSKMYRAVELVPSDRDLHRFVWRSDSSDVLQDYRMTRVTFGVSASSFAANMAVHQNAVDFATKFPLAAMAVEESFYVDDGLTGADSTEVAARLQKELQNLFECGGFLLRKWNSSNSTVLENIEPELRDSEDTQHISDGRENTKTLGLEWNTRLDEFHLAVNELPPSDHVTKRILVSDIAKTFDILGWFSPTIIKMKILLQRVWETKVDWDESIPDEIRDIWIRWRSELPSLSGKSIARCHFPKDSQIVSFQLHGFSDASEDAYSGVIYLRMVDTQDRVHTSLVISKTKVAPIKRLTIPWLELCGAQLLSQLLHHVMALFNIPLTDVFAWTDSTIVLSWLAGSPRRFKTFVGNRVAAIVDRIPPDRWRHVEGTQNPADCASRGLFPTELIGHELWWNGPTWLKSLPFRWPQQDELHVSQEDVTNEVKATCLTSLTHIVSPIVPLDRYSEFTRLRRTTAWCRRFINNCLARLKGTSEPITTPVLTVDELRASEKYWLSLAQYDNFKNELNTLLSNKALPTSSSLLSLHPFLDKDGILRVSGRQEHSKLSYSKLHPIIIHGKHPVAKLLIRSEHRRLSHGGPTLIITSLSQRFHIINCRRIVWSLIRQCVTCRRQAVKPQPQMLGQLPLERITPDSVFQRTGLDYAGPFLVKYGSIRKPTVLKAYLCIFVSLTVKAVHLELVSDMTSEAFIAALRRFASRRGLPSLLWSDHGSNFIGANRELKEFNQFLERQVTQGAISDFCSTRNIEWKFIPEHSPHFGGLWETTVKSVKKHLRKIVGMVKLTFEEMTTVLAQIKACLNSRPLSSVNSHNDDGIEILTPGHFLVGRPLTSLPDPEVSYRSISLLTRWRLCQGLVRHFWNRWSTEYLTTLNRYSKWHRPVNNIAVGDLVILREDGTVPTLWPRARVTRVYPGKDSLVRVVDVKTTKGVYRRPVTKLALLVPSESPN